MYTHKIQSFDEIQCILQHKKQSKRVIELACHCNLKLELHCYKHL
ncbi:hypothetical protein AMTRI_Chr01g132490 [Amborella trichopoda]